MEEGHLVRNVVEEGHLVRNVVEDGHLVRRNVVEEENLERGRGSLAELK